MFLSVQEINQLSDEAIVKNLTAAQYTAVRVGCSATFKLNCGIKAKKEIDLK